MKFQNSSNISQFRYFMEHRQFGGSCTKIISKPRGQCSIPNTFAPPCVLTRNDSRFTYPVAFFRFASLRSGREESRSGHQRYGSTNVSISCCPHSRVQMVQGQRAAVQRTQDQGTEYAFFVTSLGHCPIATQTREGEGNLDCYSRREATIC